MCVPSIVQITHGNHFFSENFVYRLSHNCVEELCHILSACPEMQVRSPEFGGPERVSFEKMVLITLRYLGHAGMRRHDCEKS
jgi:hypothetical protein